MQTKNPYSRQSIRLKGYDYSKAGLYFITICTHNRECLFGDIANGIMEINDVGKIANDCWLQIPQHFPNAVLHEHIIMPNHVHGIIELTDIVNVGAKHFSPISNINDTTVGANNYSPMNNSPEINTQNNIMDVGNGAKDVSPLPPDFAVDNNKANVYSPLQQQSPAFKSPSKTIGSIVRGYKIGVTKWFRTNTDIINVWQRNYHDHIIRNQQSYVTISDYIINNPMKWENDKFFRK